MAEGMENDLARLIRAIQPSGSRIRLDGAMVHLVGPDKPQGRTFAPGLLAEAVRRGLIARQADRIVALPAARAFLKRSGLPAERRYGEQHGQIDSVVTDRGLVLRFDRDESPLSSLARLKDRSGAPWFAEPLLAAGQRFAEDFNKAGLQPRLTMGWTPRVDQARGRDASGEGLSQFALDARRRFVRAAAAMGPDLADVVIDACCFDKGLERIEQERGWPVRSAKLMLRAGLMALDRHYNPAAARRAGRAAVWHSWMPASGKTDQAGT